MSRSDLAVGIAIGTCLTAAVFGVVLLTSGDDGTDAGETSNPAASAAVTTAASPSDTNGGPAASDPGPDASGRGPTPLEPASSTPVGETPAVEAVECPPATVTVTTAEELTTALGLAAPGDSIVLADGLYVGRFVASQAGTEDQPIYLCGSAAAIIDGDGIEGGYALHLDGASYWRLNGFTIRNGQKGVMADAVSDTVISGLTVEDIGDEAIHLRTNSTRNVVVGNTIRRTGLRRDKFGEGVYVGSAESNWGDVTGGEPDRSDFNVVAGNDIAETGSESVDIKEGTTGGRVVGNTMDGIGMTGADSVLDVKGNGWVIEDNVAVHDQEGLQTHRILDGWGTDNVFRNNTVDAGGEWSIYIHKPKDTDNLVECSNRTSSGDTMRINIECVE